ncbi:protein kinase domain-containing protein [Haliangium sp.]|uniref:protein kinase domain-containing protein n=1 Tax=Haliangium sp. TaxID=2663208 RepID=UPI003D0B93E2
MSDPFDHKPDPAAPAVSPSAGDVAGGADDAQDRTPLSRVRDYLASVPDETATSADVPSARAGTRRETAPSTLEDPVPGEDEPASSSRTRHTIATDVGARPPSVPTIPSTRFPPGTVLADRYRIIHLLGRGGMGEVYRAEDLKLGQPVALKFLPELLEKNAERLARLLGEVKMARAIAHDNVCRVYDLGELDGLHFISMEYVDGEHLASLLRRIGRLPVDKAIEIGQQICYGLAAVHEKGILHRDLKPANLMVDDYGRAKIMDFGLASLEADITGDAIGHGTPAYMAPEQLAGEEVSIQSDLYSLGLVLYQMFTGRFPFEGASAVELLARRAELAPTPPAQIVDSIDPFVEGIILRCLELEPGDRPDSALDVAVALSSRAAPAEGAVLKTLLCCDPIGRRYWADTVGAEGAAALMRAHAQLTRELREQHGGEVLPGSNGLRMIFDRPGHAVRYALAYHRALAALADAHNEPVRSRVGIHLGEVAFRRAAATEGAPSGWSPQVEALAQETVTRLASLAHAGQVLLTRSAFDLARQSVDDIRAARWLAHGSYELDGLVEPIDVFEVGVEGAAPLRPPEESMAGRRQMVQSTVSGWRPAPGLALPQRPRWVIEKKLSEGGFGEVWLAAHDKTHERRVFKFCYDATSLRALQREITLFRLLKEALGERDDINRIFDWNFDQPPYFIESAYTAGGDLADWAQEQGGLSKIPLATRLEIVAQVATALGAAHSVGILHKDVKPANVLITTERDGAVQAKLSDFGIGNVTEKDRLASAGITVLGLTEATEADDAGTTMAGTRLYMAPEVLEGKPVTVRADIYALGVMLFQIVVGDFSRALAPGWERSVEDEFVREDIAAAVDGDPDKRLGDAMGLAQRLRSLAERRRERDAHRREQEEARLAKEALARARGRRKFLALLVVMAVVFSGAMLFQSRRVAQEARAAQQVSDFLVELFESFDPYNAAAGDISAREILDRGAARIDSELRDQPVIRARLTHIMGEVYGNLGLYDDAITMLERALAIRRELYGDEHLEVAHTQHALGEVLVQKHAFDPGTEMLRAALATRRELLGDEHLAVADSMAALAGALVDSNHLDEAEPLARDALALRQTLLEAPHVDLAASLQLVGVLHMSQGKYAEAEAAQREAIAMFRAVHGNEALEVADGLHLLARVLLLQDQDERAKELFDESLAIRRKHLGDEHVSLAHGLAFLADIAQRRGERAEAERLNLRALELYRAYIDGDQAPMASILLSLAQLALVGQDYARAEAQCREALAIFQRLYGDRHPLVAQAMGSLGDALRAQGRYDEAINVYREYHELHLGVLGPDHPATIAAGLDFADALVEASALAKAEPLLSTARTYRDSGAEGRDEAFTHRVDSIYGAYLGRSGELDRAEELLVHAYEALSARPGPPDWMTLRALQRLIGFYQATGATDKAARYQARLPSPA